MFFLCYYRAIVNFFISPFFLKKIYVIGVGWHEGSREIKCVPNTFKCHDNRSCIPKSALCDNKFDCNDKSDELRCDETQPENFFEVKGIHPYNRSNEKKKCEMISKKFYYY